MIAIAKVTSKGQIVLPIEVRKFLDVNAGSTIVFEEEANKIVVRPAKTFKQFRGFLKNKDRVVDFDEIREKAKEYVGKKAAGHGRY